MECSALGLQNVLPTYLLFVKTLEMFMVKFMVIQGAVVCSAVERHYVQDDRN